MVGTLFMKKGIMCALVLAFQFGPQFSRVFATDEREMPGYYRGCLSDDNPIQGRIFTEKDLKNAIKHRDLQKLALILASGLKLNNFASKHRAWSELSYSYGI